jgi:hypothetical protein
LGPIETVALLKRTLCVVAANNDIDIARKLGRRMPFLVFATCNLRVLIIDADTLLLFQNCCVL